jgi:predicted secreted protein
MINRLTVLRAERAAAAEVLGELQSRNHCETHGADRRRDHMDALSRTIAHLDRAIAEWGGVTERIF